MTAVVPVAPGTVVVESPARASTVYVHVETHVPVHVGVTVGAPGVARALVVKLPATKPACFPAAKAPTPTSPAEER